jgi:hypothetical protein
MIRRLDQSYPWGGLFGDPLQGMVHELSADTTILHGWVYGDRPQSDNRATLIKKKSAYNSSVEFGDYDIMARVCQPRCQACCGCFR